MRAIQRWNRLLQGGPGLGWVGGYLVVSWGVLQVTETVASLLGFPLWFGKALLALLGIGLVAVVVTALVQSGVTSEPEDGGRRQRMRRAVTWRRMGLVGLSLFALLGAGTAGHLGARAMGVGPVGTIVARGLLPEDAELVLAELEDHTDEAGLARAATEALRVHLSQSPTIRLASAARVRDALERMAAPDRTALDLATAREVAVREGLKGVVGGEIHRVGSGYAVSARLVSAETGEELVTGLETAREPDDVVAAVERLSLHLRERIGESLRSIRRSPPLERVRTSSLAALKSYTEGADANVRGEFERCALLMEEAIALDSAFAMAYEGRAACNQNLGRNPAQQVSDRIRAYEMRDRMTEEERLRATAIYHQYVTEERRQAIEAWEAYAARFPDRASPLFNVANLYAEGRDWKRAEETLLRGLALSPSTLVVLINLAGYQANLGRFDDALATFARLEREAPGINLDWRRATLHMAAADWNAAGVALGAARERARTNPAQRATVATLQSSLAQTRGRIDEAEQFLREALAADQESGDAERIHVRLLALAELHLIARGDTARALTLLDEIATKHLRDIDPMDRGYFPLATLYAAGGRGERARPPLGGAERGGRPPRHGTWRTRPRRTRYPRSPDSAGHSTGSASATARCTTTRATSRRRSGCATRPTRSGEATCSRGSPHSTNSGAIPKTPSVTTRCWWSYGRRPTHRSGAASSMRASGSVCSGGPRENRPEQAAARALPVPWRFPGQRKRNSALYSLPSMNFMVSWRQVRAQPRSVRHRYV